VEDGSCLRSGCHDRSLLQGKVTSKRGIVFDHKPHLEAPRGRQLRCTSCHSQVVVGTHIEVTQSTCFLCHFKGLVTARDVKPIAGCQGCHGAPRGDIRLGSVTFNHEDIVKRGVACQNCHLNVIEGDGDAPRERCYACHNEPDKLMRHGDPASFHDLHVAGKNIECIRCHTVIKHRLPAPIGLPTASRGAPAAPGAGGS
jgi:hypothetical protein